MPKDPKRSPRKPSGETGPFTVKADGIQQNMVPFPTTKVGIEEMVGKLFVRNVRRESLSFAPFSQLRSNAEADLDFTVACGDGTDRLLELVEFAPLQSLNVSYEDAPRQFGVKQMAQLVSELVAKKSSRQGGTNRLLLMYHTAQQFSVLPPVQELVRRMLCKTPPAFDAVYFLSPHSADEASVYELWPGKPNDMFRDVDDEKLGLLRMHRAYPDEFRRTVTGGKVIFTRRI